MKEVSHGLFTKNNEYIVAERFVKMLVAALPYVLTMAQQYGTAVHLLYVLEDLSQNDSWYGKFDVSHVNTLIEWEIKKLGSVSKKFAGITWHCLHLMLNHLSRAANRPFGIGILG